jgi:hypothetical protein
VAKWKIERSGAAVPKTGDRNPAFAFLLSAEGPLERHVTVEYAAPSSTATLAHAMQAVQRYLNADEPPRRLLVGRNGDARPIE